MHFVDGLDKTNDLIDRPIKNRSIYAIDKKRYTRAVLGRYSRASVKLFPNFHFGKKIDVCFCYHFTTVKDLTSLFIKTELFMKLLHCSYPKDCSCIVLGVFVVLVQ